jgi:hypothetical protein
MKKIIVVAITAMLSLALFGCNKEEDPQQLFLEGSKALEEANTLESKSTIDVNIEVNETENSIPLTTEELQIIKAINSAEVNVTSIVDTQSEKYEMVLDASLELGFIKPEIKATMLMDYKNNTIYMDGSALYDEFYLFIADTLPPTFDASIIKDHLVVVDLEKIAEETAGELTFDELKVAPEIKSADIISGIAKENFSLLELSKEDKAKKAKNKVKLTLSGEELESIVIDVMEKINKEAVETIEIDLEMFTFNNFTVTTLYGKEGNVMEEKVSMSFTVTETEFMNSMNVDFTVVTEYMKINEPVTFNIDPETDKKVDFMEIMQQLLMHDMGF